MCCDFMVHTYDGLRCVFVIYCVWGVLCFLWCITVMFAVCVHHILCVACYGVLCFFVFHICEGGGACGDNICVQGGVCDDCGRCDTHGQSLGESGVNRKSPRGI